MTRFSNYKSFFFSLTSGWTRAWCWLVGWQWSFCHSFILAFRLAEVDKKFWDCFWPMIFVFDVLNTYLGIQNVCIFCCIVALLKYFYILAQDDWLLPLNKLNTVIRFQNIKMRFKLVREPITVETFIYKQV